MSIIEMISVAMREERWDETVVASRDILAATLVIN